MQCGNCGVTQVQNCMTRKSPLEFNFHRAKFLANQPTQANGSLALPIRTHEQLALSKLSHNHSVPFFRKRGASWLAILVETTLGLPLLETLVRENRGSTRQTHSKIRYHPSGSVERDFNTPSIRFEPTIPLRWR